MDAKARRNVTVNALLDFIDGSHGSLHAKNKNDSANLQHRWAQFRSFIKESDLKRVKDGQEVHYSVEELAQMVRAIFSQHAQPTCKKEGVQMFYTHGTSVLNPHWLREIGYKPSSRAGADDSAMADQTNIQHTPLRLSLKHGQSFQTPQAGERAVMRGQRSRVSLGKVAAEDDESSYSPSSASTTPFEGTKAIPKVKGNQPQPVGAKMSLDSPNLPNLKRGEDIESATHPKKRQRIESPESDSHALIMFDENGGDRHHTSAPLIANFPRIGVDQVEIKKSMDSIFSTMKTVVDDAIERQSIDEFGGVIASDKPSQSLENLYQETFNVGHWKDRLARLSCLGACSASHVLVALISTFLVSSVYGKPVPWTVPDGVMLNLAEDKKFLARNLKLFDINLDEIVRKSCLDKIGNPDFQDTVIIDRANDLRRGLTFTLAQHFDSLLRQKPNGSAQWMDTWDPMINQILKTALILKGKMNVSPENYTVLAYAKGQKFDAWRMEGVTPSSHTSETSGDHQLEVAMTLCHGVTVMPYEGRPKEVLVKAKVLLTGSKSVAGK